MTGKTCEDCVLLTFIDGEGLHRCRNIYSRRYGQAVSPDESVCDHWVPLSDGFWPPGSYGAERERINRELAGVVDRFWNIVIEECCRPFEFMLYRAQRILLQIILAILKMIDWLVGKAKR